jgi:hypothetical protein
MPADMCSTLLPGVHTLSPVTLGKPAFGSDVPDRGAPHRGRFGRIPLAPKSSSGMFGKPHWDMVPRGGGPRNQAASLSRQFLQWLGIGRSERGALCGPADEPGSCPGGVRVPSAVHSMSRSGSLVMRPYQSRYLCAVLPVSCTQCHSNICQSHIGTFAPE